MGFFSCFPHSGDVIVYNEYIHASVHDGIWLSQAKDAQFLFSHNLMPELWRLLVGCGMIEQARGWAKTAYSYLWRACIAWMGHLLLCERLLICWMRFSPLKMVTLLLMKLMQLRYMGHKNRAVLPSWAWRTEFWQGYTLLAKLWQ